jgi:hypothetical protein
MNNNYVKVFEHHILKTNQNLGPRYIQKENKTKNDSLPIFISPDQRRCDRSVLNAPLSLLTSDDRPFHKTEPWKRNDVDIWLDQCTGIMILNKSVNRFRVIVGMGTLSFLCCSWCSRFCPVSWNCDTGPAGYQEFGMCIVWCCLRREIPKMYLALAHELTQLNLTFSRSRSLAVDFMSQ